MIGTSKSVWGFDPRSVPGCQFWLDAADPAGTGTLPANGSTLSTWVDKSGNARNLGVGSGTTSYSSNAIVLNSSYMFVNSPVNLTNVTVFIISKSTGVTNQTILGAKPNTDYVYNSVDGFGFYNDPPTGRIRFYGQGNDSMQSIFFTDTSTPKLYSFQSTGTTVSGWLNGTSQSGGTLTTTRTSTAQGFAIGAEWGGTSYVNIWVTASIYEILVYNTALTTSERQQVEGYLAHKWGLTTSVPSTHPFSSIRPHLRTFQPIDVPGCQLWLDAADQSSMTLSGSNVTQWNDKSGNGRNVIQTTTTPTDRRPTYSNGVLNFNGANFLSGTNTFSVVDSGTLFAVARHSSTRGRVIDIRNNTMSLGIEFGTTPDLFFHNSFGRWGQSFTDGTNDLQIIVNTRNGSSAPQYARNGGSLISFTSSQSTPADNGSYFAVGYDPTGAQYLNGVLCEIIYYSNTLTTSQRQQVEGYLAHKWGLTTPIPSPHPFKSFPPASLYLEPATKYSALFNTANNSSLTIPANAALTLGTNNHTIEFWLYQTSRNQYALSFCYGNTSYFATNNYFMDVGQTEHGQVVVGNGAGGWAVNINVVRPTSLNVWNHYAVVRNGTTFTVYINGTAIGSGSSSINIPAQGDVFRIGNTTVFPIAGYITNFRLVNGTALYTSNFIPSTLPLTAIPNTQILLQGLVDRSPNAFTVTNNGGVSLSTLSPFPT